MKNAVLVAAAGGLLLAPSPASADRVSVPEVQITAHANAPTCIPAGKTRAVIRVRNADTAHGTWVTLRINRKHVTRNRQVEVGAGEVRRLRVRARPGRAVSSVVLDRDDKRVAATQFAGYPC